MNKCFKSETTSFHYFSLRIPKSKKVGQWTSGMGGKTFQRIEQSVTDRQTDKQTYIRTFQLIERIGPEGQFFENIYITKVSVKLMVLTNLFSLLQGGP